tara:strand:- start:5450 stop:5560 length:111 start_codon:yes stop_codon:yes gene_type:complete
MEPMIATDRLVKPDRGEIWSTELQGLTPWPAPKGNI